MTSAIADAKEGEIATTRAEVRAEAFREAAEWCAQKVAAVREVTRDCRKEAIALKERGEDWSEAFQRECLSDSRRGAFSDAERHFRALAAAEKDASAP